MCTRNIVAAIASGIVGLSCTPTATDSALQSRLRTEVRPVVNACWDDTEYQVCVQATWRIISYYKDTTARGKLSFSVGYKLDWITSTPLTAKYRFRLLDEHGFIIAAPIGTKSSSLVPQMEPVVDSFTFLADSLEAANSIHELQVLASFE